MEAERRHLGDGERWTPAQLRAEAYLAQWRKWRTDGSDEDERPTRDLQLETLAGVLTGDILVHNHCYRADEMATMIDIAAEFEYSIASFHHGVEAYKIRDVLAHRVSADARSGIRRGPEETLWILREILDAVPVPL